MKKISLFSLFLLIYSYAFIVNASSINLESTQNFYPNQGVVESRPIKIDIINYNIGSSLDKSFSLILPEDSNIRFSEDFSSIKFSGNALAKISTGITISPNLRELKFNLFDYFSNGDSLDLTGLKFKVYSKPQGDRYIGLDLNGDSNTDAISINGYRVSTTFAYSDTLSPSEVFNFTGSIVDNKFTVSADMPGDLDFQAITLDNLDGSGNVLSSFFRYDLNNFSYDLQSNYDSIRIKTVDLRANYSTGLTFKLDIFKSNLQTTENIVDTGSVVVEEPILGSPELVVETVEKYIPTFTVQERLLNKVVLFIDDYISKKTTNENLVLITRNKIIIELELLDTASMDQKPEIVKNIRAYFKELAMELKK